MKQQITQFWSLPVSEVLKSLQATPEGLTNTESQKRLINFGANILRPKKNLDNFTIFLSQFKSPIILILIFASILSYFLGDTDDSIIILLIVFVSGLLGFWQEKGAVNAVEKLLAIVKTKLKVLRDKALEEISIEKIVPGDVVALDAGDAIPGDSLILESKDLFVDEATLTGETYPVEKFASVLPADTLLSRRTCALFMGTHVVSGSAKAVVVYTGKETEFGRISERLKLRPTETEFERGIRRFGYLLMEVTLILVLTIFAVNVYFARPVLDSFLFSLALAVGLTPQLLPAIISINLAHGAKRMAADKVIVKKLTSIENFGSMNVLCSDKTGTLTEGIVHLNSALDIEGNPGEKVLLYAYINAFYETGFTNPIDEAIRKHSQFDLSNYNKLDEVPYDFIRKRLTVLVSKDNINLMITKGALKNVLAVCSLAQSSTGTTVDISTVTKKINRYMEEFSNKGFRVLGVAFKDNYSDSYIKRDCEKDMTFLGFLTLFDPPKPSARDTINRLKQLGVSLKIITGDNHLVSTCISHQVGLYNPQIITGQELYNISNEALLQKVNEVDIFAEIEPNQKERIILALRKSGNVVGYMGDGINDAPALHAADVGISVDSAADVAKESADIVLLEKDLSTLVNGVQEGRKTFANTLKYVFMATSANFGNMFSMAGASLFMPFLPLLPKQILLTNLMTDFPEMTIAADNVDEELIEKPRRWNIAFIRKFMFIFGILSSLFDYMTFGVLLFMLHATPEQFRTGWFLESVISATLIVLVVRSRRPFFRSKPGKYLLLATFTVVIFTLIFPIIIPGRIFEFTTLPPLFILLMGIIVILYVITAELIKKGFYKKVKF